MDKYFTHTAEEYRQAVKVFKALVSMPPDKKRSGPAYEHERAMIALALEALRYASLMLENPPLTRAHLKEMHGQAVYLEHTGGLAVKAGVVDCRSDTIITLDPCGGACAHEWFYGFAGRYYRFPLDKA